MAQEMKTVAIDSSELLAAQRSAAGEERIPKTVAIDLEQLARRRKALAERRDAGAGGAHGWLVAGGILVGVLIALAVVG